MNCKKCDTTGTVVLRKKDYYCQVCFINNTNHKFRACIGKNKIFSSNENVLVCLSGGKGSVVMMDLIYTGISLDSHKRLRIKPLFLHLYNGDHYLAEFVIEQCRKYKFDVYVVDIFSKTLCSSNIPQVNTIPTNLKLSNYSDKKAKCLQPSLYNDFLNKIKRSLIIRVAELLDCKFIFTGETTTCLASNLLSNIALGRGSQVESDVGFIDDRNENVKIVRPMKDISTEELNWYVEIKNLNPPENHIDVQKNSLQMLINNFVSDLQENFPATISTVCKTADKLGVITVENHQKKSNKCKLCESSLNVAGGKFTALQATEFSKLVSLNEPSSLGRNGNINVSAPDHHSINCHNEPMFPHINKHLCYSCSRNYSESNESVLAQHIDELLNKCE